MEIPWDFVDFHHKTCDKTFSGTDWLKYAHYQRSIYTLGVAQPFLMSNRDATPPKVVTVPIPVTASTRITLRDVTNIAGWKMGAPDGRCISYWKLWFSSHLCDRLPDGIILYIYIYVFLIRVITSKAFTCHKPASWGIILWYINRTAQSPWPKRSHYCSCIASLAIFCKWFSDQNPCLFHLYIGV